MQGGVQVCPWSQQTDQLAKMFLAVTCNWATGGLARVRWVTTTLFSRLEKSDPSKYIYIYIYICLASGKQREPQKSKKAKRGANSGEVLDVKHPRALTLDIQSWAGCPLVFPSTWKKPPPDVRAEKKAAEQATGFRFFPLFPLPLCNPKEVSSNQTSGGRRSSTSSWLVGSQKSQEGK